MSEPNNIIMIPSLPGVRRDGTGIDGDYFTDAQWTRFTRNRPRKMGGYQLSSPYLSGPSRGLLIWPAQYSQTVINFSEYGIEYCSVDSQSQIGSTVTDITPAGYVFNPNTLWSWDVVYDSASTNATLVALNSSALSNMDDATAGTLYKTILTATPVAPLTAIADTNSQASGGCFVAYPYTVVLGSAGYCAWSDANTPSQFTTGDAGNARITGQKVICGLPLRTGFSQGGILWSLDSVLRMDYIGAPAIFKFSHISTDSSILSQNGVIEYLGTWYWAGIDRFFTSNGSQVNELPNEMNQNWFFDNLNFSQRQKVFAMKMPRWGEIWWFFPFGDSIECSNVVIYNVRLKTWYDLTHNRSSGTTSKIVKYPMMADTVPNALERMTLTVVGGAFQNGDAIVGGTSAATGIIDSISGAGPYSIIVQPTNSKTFVATETVTDQNSKGGTLTLASGAFNAGNTVMGVTSGALGIVQSISGGGPYSIVLNSVNPAFVNGETLTNMSIAGSGTLSALALSSGTVSAFRSQYNLYIHEIGYDAVVGQNVNAIPAWFTTCDFGLPTGGPQPNAVEGKEGWTRLTIVEPDFVQIGSMTMTILGRKYATSPIEQSEFSPYTFQSTDGVIEPRVQFREIMVKFESNTLGGFYEGGKTLFHLDQGDLRR